MLRNIDAKTFERVWKIVEEIGVQERHFNDLQTRIRSMASLWLLSTFAAIGFLATQDLKLVVPRELLVAIVAVAGCVGIVLLWVVDLLVYHRLLDSCFVVGLGLEKRYPWLPPFRTNMMRTQGERGVLFRVVGFYVGPVVLLILVSGGALSLWLSGLHPIPAVLCVVVTIAIAALVGRGMPRKTENTADLAVTLTRTSKRRC